MKTAELHPLAPGDYALRFRVEWSTGSPRIAGLQTVQVIAVNGEHVTWTNHKPARAGALTPFSHVSHRRELIALAALENISRESDEKSAVTEMAGAGRAG